MIRIRFKVGLSLVAIFSLITSQGISCAISQNFDNQLGAITSSYQFNIASWEISALFDGIKKTFICNKMNINVSIEDVKRYFDNVKRIKMLESQIKLARTNAWQAANELSVDELNRLRKENAEKANAVQRRIETQINEILSEQGIYNPLERYIGTKAKFPPVNFVLMPPPHILVISPRDRIESIRRVALVAGMGPEDMERIEDSVDGMGVASLVLEVGGYATYPSYITDKGDLRFTINTAVEEWLHQYLAFKPLGFRYLLDSLGISRNYEIATMNETLAGIVSRELGDMLYKKYYSPNGADDSEPQEKVIGFDFNREMREIRKAVDIFLAKGEIEGAEEYMEQKRLFLATKGYHIRKLNQAYFAFHGTYSDKPAYLGPIGDDMEKLRNNSATLKEFLEKVALMTNRQDLNNSIN